MPLDEFWHGDLRLFDAYQKAYENNISYTAWANGQYTYIATTYAIANAFGKKGSKPLEYPKWKPVEFEKKQEVQQPQQKNLTREQIEEKGKTEVIKQEQWFRTLMKS